MVSSAPIAQVHLMHLRTLVADVLRSNPFQQARLAGSAQVIDLLVIMLSVPQTHVMPNFSCINVTLAIRCSKPSAAIRSSAGPSSSFATAASTFFIL